MSDPRRIERRQLLWAAGTGAAGAAALRQLTVTPSAGAMTPSRPAGAAVIYVSGSGDDGSDGSSPATAMRSLQAAYASLPDGGGTLHLGAGRYDVLDGLQLSPLKPAWLVGEVRPRKYVPSESRSPYPGGPAAVIFSSLGATSLIITTRPPKDAMGYGFKFSDLVFELTAPSTKFAIDMNTVNMGEVEGCVFWADVHTWPAAEDAVAVRVFTDRPDGDSSWWRIHDNVAAGLALCILGNDTGPRYNSNQHVVRENIALGKGRSTTNARPCIRIVGSHRSVVRDNNIEAYRIGIQFQGCWMCTEDSDGGEVVDTFVDLLGCNGCRIAPIGISTPTVALPGALLVQGDHNSDGNIVVAAGAYSGAASRTYPGSAGISLSNHDNVVTRSR